MLPPEMRLLLPSLPERVGTTLPCTASRKRCPSSAVSKWMAARLLRGCSCSLQPAAGRGEQEEQRCFHLQGAALPRAMGN